MFEPPQRWLRRHAVKVAANVFVRALNAALLPQLSTMQRGALRERVVLIGLLDMAFDCRLRLHGRRFEACRPDMPVDVAVRARLRDYLRLLRREIDADALFFQRRLRVEGDTELGLAIKNMLDSMEVPAPLARLLAIGGTGSGAPFDRH